MEMELQKDHFSHEHPLKLIELKTNDGKTIVCKGCCQKISGSAYGCRNCSFFLHKICTELPAETKHPLHPPQRCQHPLTLLPKAPYPHNIFSCDACYKDKDAFTYHCSLCTFDVDIRCAVRAQTVEHRSHKHPLRPVLSPASFDCQACGMKREGVSYMCNTCRFWIHEGCFWLPITVKHSSHIHPLTLIYSVSDIHGKEYSIQYLGYGHSCSICKEKFSRNVWAYHCEECMYFAHVNCATKTEESKTGIEVEDADEANLIHLPVANESVCLIKLFAKQTRLEYKRKEEELIQQFAKQMSLEDKRKEEEVIHFSHDHPLTLFNALSDHDSSSKIEKICGACVLAISAPFYSCSNCNFFLHKWCAELPNELQHLCHPHPLTLLTKSQHDRSIVCDGCVEMCHGFAFKCLECEDFYLDIKCASLPSSVMHEFHEHRLLLKRDCIDQGCAACDRRMPIFSFGCETCNFNLHCICALLPHKIWHWYGRQNPFILTYGPIDGTEEYLCEFCEEEINPKWWFYYCIQLDMSACAKCINKQPNRNPNPNIKQRMTFNFNHEHPLEVVQAMNKSPPCDECHEVFYNYQAAFKCTKCHIMLHPFCACPDLISHYPIGLDINPPDPSNPSKLN